MELNWIWNVSGMGLEWNQNKIVIELTANWKVKNGTGMEQKWNCNETRNSLE